MNAAYQQPTKKRVFIVGVGCTKFTRPQSSQARPFPDLARDAVQDALKDSGLNYNLVQSAVVGYCYGDPTCGQRAVYENGLTGIPVINVNNNCSTGSTALFVARQFVEGGMDCVLALGMETMKKNLSQVHQDAGWLSPTDKHWDAMFEFGDDRANANFAVTREPTSERWNDFTDNVCKLFAYATREHAERYGSTPEHLAKIAYKNHKHSVNNPRALMQREFTMEQIRGAPVLLNPLTLLEACPTADGAGAALLVSEDFVQRHGLWERAVEVAGQAMVTDLPSSFQDRSFITLSGYDMARRAARQALAMARLTPRDVDVVELHDCFAANEMMMYEALGLCDQGKGGELIDSGVWETGVGGGELCRIGDRWVVNPSGGLLSKGHPIGATGLAQCCELVWQLRSEAERRQVLGATVGLQHNFGIGGAAVVTVYRKAGAVVSKL